MHDVDPDELAAWLRLVLTPRLGHTTRRRLLAAFGSPQALWAAPAATRRAVAGDTLAAALSRPPATLAPQHARTLDWLAGAPADNPRTALPLGGPRFPGLL